MNVYIVMREIRYEGDTVISVFSNPVYALLAADELNHKNPIHLSDVTYVVKTHEVLGEPNEVSQSVS